MERKHFHFDVENIRVRGFNAIKSWVADESDDDSTPVGPANEPLKLPRCADDKADGQSVGISVD